MFVNTPDKNQADLIASLVNAGQTPEERQKTEELAASLKPLIIRDTQSPPPIGATGLSELDIDP